MSIYRSRNRLVLAKNEAATGVEETPTPTANAVRVTDVDYTPNFEVLDTSSEVTGSVSVPPPIVGGGNVGMRLGCYLKGAGTAGAAPQYGPLLRASGFSQTLTAAAVTGTAQAGGATSITLAVGASAVDNAYRGMVIRITGGPGNGESNVITAYNGATKVATVARAWTVQPTAASTYSIDANALYKPVSTGLETATFHLYDHHNDPAQNSRLRKLIGAAGRFSLSLSPRGLATLAFNFSGLLPAAPTNVAKPADPVYDAVDPEPFLNAEALLGGSAVKFSEFSVDLGADINLYDNPAAAYGFDPAQITMRRPTGRIVPNLVLLSSRNSFNDFLTSTSRELVLRWGSAAGRRVALYFPSLRYTGAEQADVRGFTAEGLPFQASGLDSEVYICVH